jgi:hypothetical protein
MKQAPVGQYNQASFDMVDPGSRSELLNSCKRRGGVRRKKDLLPFLKDVLQLLDIIPEKFELSLLDLFLKLAPGVGKSDLAFDGKKSEYILQIFDFHMNPPEN